MSTDETAASTPSSPAKVTGIKVEGTGDLEASLRKALEVEKAEVKLARLYKSNHYSIHVCVIPFFDTKPQTRDSIT